MYGVSMVILYPHERAPYSVNSSFTQPFAKPARSPTSLRLRSSMHKMIHGNSLVRPLDKTKIKTESIPLWIPWVGHCFEDNVFSLGWPNVPGHYWVMACVPPFLGPSVQINTTVWVDVSQFTKIFEFANTAEISSAISWGLRYCFQCERRQHTCEVPKHAIQRSL